MLSCYLKPVHCVARRFNARLTDRRMNRFENLQAGR